MLMGRETLPLDGEVDAVRFVALSPGIGLGEPRAKVVQATAKPSIFLPASPPPRLPVKSAGASFEAVSSNRKNGEAGKRGGGEGDDLPAPPSWTGAAAFPPDSATPVASAEKRAQARLGRRLLGWSLDFALV